MSSDSRSGEPDDRRSARFRSAEPPANPGRSNRLSRESSPYLHQHSMNPVDWYPWGDEAIERARREDKPIFLSIGYSACHWCHVMERESFENAAIARILNDSFVNVKVDREERPDIDRIYMSAVQAMTGSGGWPLSVFLPPELKPFFGGTYFPPEDRHGQAGFGRVVSAVADAYRTRRPEIENGATAVADRIRAFGAPTNEKTSLVPALIDASVESLAANYDPDNGGFGEMMKFPQPMVLGLLLRQWRRTGDLAALEMVRTTLDHMDAGGIYDHLGGGFHRYATEPRWLIPHFEKMLYDNALIVTAHVEAWQVTDDPAYARVVGETLDYLVREMKSPDGGFYSTQDADVGEDEGGFYLWTPEELISVLGEEDAALFARAYGVDDAGNFEGRSILNRVKGDELLAEICKTDADSIRRRLASSRAALYAARKKRPRPRRDEKVLADWNALAITAFTRAARALGEPRYLLIAENAARFVLERMRDSSGALMHVHKDGHARVPAFLSDHANMAFALIDLYEATGQAVYLDQAAAFADVILCDFIDEKGCGFFDTAASGGRDLIARTREATDGATPSGNMMAIASLIRLSRITGERRWIIPAEAALRSFAGMLEKLPGGMTQMALALDLFLAPSQEIAIIGPADAERTRALRAVVDRRFLPHSVLVWGEGSGSGGLAALEGKTMIGGRPAAYVCRDFMCGQPATSPEELAAELGA
jgi:uncharacterized protein